MTTPRFLQVHTLHSYPAALLNRDDSGLAKRMPFGGVTRTRISSQCLKRHWRDPKDERRHEYALHRIPDTVTAVRSRNAVGRKTIQPFRGKEGINEDVLNRMEEEFTKGVYGENAKPGETREAESTRQPLLLGLPEIEFLRRKAAEVCDKHPNDAEAAAMIVKGLLVTEDSIRKATGKTKVGLRDARKAAAEMFGSEELGNFEVFRKNLALPGGLVGALFGRMVTSDPGANIEAAVHVAHAFTVHQEESESDYFSVVDDLQGDDEDPGAAHIGDMELTAGLFYGYVVVDVPGLVSNLSQDQELAAKVVEHLVHLIATVSPGAKLGSTAPYGYADLVLIEAGARQPRSLANAFRKPVADPQVEDAVQALSERLSKLDGAYGASEARRVMSVEDCAIPGAERLNLDSLAAWAAESVRTGAAA